MAAGLRHFADQMKRVIVGAVCVAAYLLAASLTKIPVRPLYDGLAPPQPYRWVSPPPDFASSNKRPRPYAESVNLDKNGLIGASISTPDGQATLILPAGSIPARAGARRVRFRFVPLDANRLPPPPRAKAAQGNAYEITARYVPGDATALPKQNVTVLLRYPAHATELLLLTNGRWKKLKAQAIPANLQIYANTKKLGTFVVTGAGSSRAILWYITGGACGVAALLGLVLGLRERRAGPRRR